MLSFEEAAEYLDTVVDELPEVLLRELNGGVNIVPQVMRSNKNSALYTLGQYNKGGKLGRYIIIYYGSFKASFPGASDEMLKNKLREVLLHELTHHNESLAGIKDLEYMDEAQVAHYESTGEFLPISNFAGKEKGEQ
ncbi:MAG: hypothetical protein E7597_06140 [Ruminococcaceae bacterium]|nr:hypothetical protein [Oscillospiraceae bacterium]